MSHQKKPRIDASLKEETFEKLYDYVIQKAHWIIFTPFGDQLFMKKIELIENKYFTPGTDANADFVLILFDTMDTLAIFPKARVSLEEMSQVFDGYPIDPKIQVFFPMHRSLLWPFPYMDKNTMDFLTETAQAFEAIQQARSEKIP